MQVKMLKKAAFLVLLILVLGNQGIFAQEKGVVFEKGSYEDALKKAKMLNKPVFVQVYASWVEPSKGMDDWIFTDERVGEYFNAQFVNWRFVTDSVEDYTRFGKIRILALPEFLFLNAAGELLYRNSGFLDAEETVVMAKKALVPANQLSALQKQYDSGNRKPAFMVNYLTQMDAAGKDITAQGMTYLHKIPEYELGDENNWKIQYLCLYDMDSREFRNLLNQKEVYGKAYGQEQVMDVILRCYRGRMELAVANKDEKLFESLKPVIDQVVSNPTERKTTWLREQMNFNEGIGNWKGYFEAAKALFALPDTDFATLLNDAAWAASEHSTDSGLWITALGWAEKSITLEPHFYNFHTKATLLSQLKRWEEAEKYAIKARDKALEEDVPTEEADELIKFIIQNRD